MDRQIYWRDIMFANKQKFIGERESVSQLFIIGKSNIVWKKYYWWKTLLKSTLLIEEYYSKRTLKIGKRDYNFE